MTRTLAALFALAVCLGHVSAEVINMDGYRSETPKSWKSEEPSNKMRFAQFRIKGPGGAEDAELVIFKGITGTAKANVERWKGQFTAPKGKAMDDVSKVSEVRIGGLDATQLEITGTYNFNPAPFNPKSKSVPKADYKMVAIQFDGPDTVYHIKLTGPAKTVDAARKDFDAWIKGFKK
jgi:hypothetical protein